MKVYAKHFGDGIKCYGCGWETSKVFVLADSPEEAEELFEDEEYLCGECLADLLSEGNYEIRKNETPSTRRRMRRY